MKNHQKKILFIEILGIFLLFCLEPLIAIFLPTSETQFHYNFFYFFVYGLFSLYFYLSTQENKANNTEGFSKKALLSSFYALILLYTLSFVSNLINSLFSTAIKNQESIQNYGIAFTGILFAVVFEELLYRKFFPYKMEKLFENTKIHPKLHFFLVEIFPIILFSLCHWYNGIFASIYAFFAGIILRRLYLKTKHIIFPISVHTLYNFGVFIIQYSLCQQHF